MLWKFTGPDLGRGPWGPGPQASHQKGASHQTLQFLFRPGLPPVKSGPGNLDPEQDTLTPYFAPVTLTLTR